MHQSPKNRGRKKNLINNFYCLTKVTIFALEKGAEHEHGMKEPIEIEGRVEHGQGLGRTLGVPTANIAVPSGLAVAFGVYAATVRIEGDLHEWVAAVSVGVRPTVEAHGRPVLECFLIDYHGGAFYGQQIVVRLVQYLRGEIRFDTTAQLVEQINRDIEHVKQIVLPIKHTQTK